MNAKGNRKPEYLVQLMYQNYNIANPEQDKHKDAYNNPFNNNMLVNHIINGMDQRRFEKSMDPTDQIFDDRLSVIRSKLELLLLQLGQRKTINQKILYQIDVDSCRVQNLYFNLGPRAYDMGRDRMAVEKMRFDLQRQRRMEEASYFKDTALLNRDLKDTLIQYMEEVQKSSLITGDVL